MSNISWILPLLNKPCELLKTKDELPEETLYSTSIEIGYV